MKKKIEWSDAELAEIIKSVDAEAERVIAKKEEESEESEEKEESEEDKKKKKEKEDKEKEDKEKEEKDEDMDKSEEKQIEELYSEMSKNEAEAHYSCLKKVLFGKASEEQTAPVQKSEESSEDKEVELVKSENETLKKNIEAYEKVIEVLKRKVSAPIQKAVTGLDYIKKSDLETKEGEKGQLTKSEIDTKLNEVIKSDISGSDRNKINQFYLGKGSFETIKHLVTK